MQGSVRDTISLFLCVYIQYVRTYIHTVRIHTCTLHVYTYVYTQRKSQSMDLMEVITPTLLPNASPPLPPQRDLMHICPPPPTHSCTLAHPHPHYTHSTHPPTCTTSCFSISMKVRQMSKASCLVLGLPLKAFATSPGTTSPHTLQTWSRAQHFTHTRARKVHICWRKNSQQIIAYTST